MTTAIEKGAPRAAGGTMNSSHALPTEQVLSELHVDPAKGLNDDDIAERRRQGGENVLPHAKRRPLARLLLEQFLNIIVLLLASRRRSRGRRATSRKLSPFSWSCC
ncbi:MAG: cation-transporting P-type ATPase [Thermoanaerobaculia bacterium]